MTEKLNFGTIITDCSDPNAAGRQIARFAELLGVQPTFIGVEGEHADLAAAGNLVDRLGDATDLPTSAANPSGVILVNVAPRGEKKNGDDNGTPFCSFWAGEILVVSTLRGRSLSLAQRLGYIENNSVAVYNIPDVTAEAVKWGELSERQASRINDTQFRSLRFSPLVARWLLDGKGVPHREEKLEPDTDIVNRAWFIDNFGNVKTTLSPEDIGFEADKEVVLADGRRIACYRRLADVPKGESGLVIGSSHLDGLLEVVVQKGKAAKRHKFKVGSKVLASI